MKECAETMYWLELLYDTGYLSEKEYKSLYSDCEEMKKMMQSTHKNSDRITPHSKLNQRRC